MWESLIGPQVTRGGKHCGVFGSLTPDLPVREGPRGDYESTEADGPEVIIEKV